MAPQANTEIGFMQKQPINLEKISFQSESLIDLQEEISPLLVKHFTEISHYPDILLNPDWDRYFALENGGLFKVFTAREEGVLIGYNAFFLNTNAHYKDSKQASQDVIFIDPSRRGFGKLFIQWCDEQLKEMGIQVVYHHLKAKKNFGPMLETIGYELVDLIYAKRLDKEKLNG